MTWTEVLGRVSFCNCDPVYNGISDNWKIFSAPPSWLCGHVIRRDCVTAPIPTADYARFKDELFLLPDLAIISRGDTGSVLVFGNRPLESMRDIAVPTDSSSSKQLLDWILEERGLDPRRVEMAPDLERMLSECDGALMIGDRALLESIANPKLVIMDLGAEWTSMTGLPMVFGVFAARKDTDTSVLAKAHSEMLYQLDRFDNDLTWRLQVITNASISTGLSETRLDNYYRSEVWNRLDEDALRGLDMYLKQVCGCSEGAEWANLD
ncbi:MAG: hypothetical protein CMA85_00915 [Euryarchaeota archaeon]|nr:hypothetical protein [Euryarchaeota archaeon]